MNKILKDKLFVQVGNKELSGKLWLIAFFKINCEIYIPPELIDIFQGPELDKIRDSLDQHGLLRRVHAPIYNPYRDGFVILKEAYLESLKLCSMLGMTTIVMHAQYDEKESSSVDEWFNDTVKIWEWIAESAEKNNVQVLLENHHEDSAGPVVRILNHVGGESMHACFDIGHFNAFGKKDIVSFLDDYPRGSIKEVHLSDNAGDDDTHLALGKGSIDFIRFFKAIDDRGMNPVYTIEAKDLWGVVHGMRHLKKIGRL